MDKLNDKQIPYVILIYKNKVKDIYTFIIHCLETEMKNNIRVPKDTIDANLKISSFETTLSFLQKESCVNLVKENNLYNFEILNLPKQFVHLSDIRIIPIKKELRGNYACLLKFLVM